MKCEVTNSKGERCKNEVKSGICRTHQSRIEAIGHVDADRPIRSYTKPTKPVIYRQIEGATEEERFRNQIDKQGEHWLWTGPTQQHGWPIGKFEGITSAVRIAWTLVHGRPGQDEKVRQTCGEKLCLKPAHLEVVPMSAPRKRDREMVLA